jgi:hypothetical protein
MRVIFSLVSIFILPIYLPTYVLFARSPLGNGQEHNVPNKIANTKIISGSLKEPLGTFNKYLQPDHNTRIIRAPVIMVEKGCFYKCILPLVPEPNT